MRKKILTASTFLMVIALIFLGCNANDIIPNEDWNKQTAISSSSDLPISSSEPPPPPISSSSSSDLPSSSSEEPLPSSSSEEPFPSSSSVHLCNGVIYDPLTHSCYDDSTYSCGNQPYDPSTQFCYNNYIFNKCNGQIYAPPDQQCNAGVVQEACGNGWFNPSTQFCYGGNTPTLLCGGNSYSTAQFCQNSNVYSKCNGNDYNVTTYICCNNSQYSLAAYGCCNNEAYTLSTHFCHNGTTYALCGGQSYNPATHFCYSNEVFTCNNQKYNPISQFCYNGTTVYDRCGGGYGALYDPLTEACCGNGKYNKSTHFCFNSTAYAFCSDQSYDPSTHFCFNSTIYALCGGESYNTAAQGCCGNQRYILISQFCYNGATIYDRCGGGYGASYDPSTHYCSEGTLKSYGVGIKSVVIGTQTWMAENLNYNTASGSKCIMDDPANCEKYGRLYDWATALTVCPSGWHLPSDAEWTVLTDYVGGEETAGTKLKARSGWSDDGNGTDAYGFSALPGGYRRQLPVFGVVEGFKGEIGGWWSATDYGTGAYIREMQCNHEYIVTRGVDKETSWNSVRCVKN